MVRVQLIGHDLSIHQSRGDVGWVRFLVSVISSISAIVKEERFNTIPSIVLVQAISLRKKNQKVSERNLTDSATMAVGGSQGQYCPSQGGEGKTE